MVLTVAPLAGWLVSALPAIMNWSQNIQRCGQPWWEIKIGITRGGMGLLNVGKWNWQVAH